MKIKVKVKTLILVSLGILFFIFEVIPFANIELANYLSEEKPEIAEKLYDNYIKYPTGFRKAEALYKKAENIIDELGRYNIMQGGNTWNKLLNHDSIIEALENNEKIIEKYSKSDYYVKAYKRIMDIYIYSGDEEKLKEWIQWGRNKDNEEILQICILYEGYYYFTNREYDKADKILESFILGNRDMDYIYYFLKGHIEFARENFDKSLEYYDKSNEIDWQHKTNFFGSVAPDGRREWLNELDFHKGQNIIRGRITTDGIGMPFVEVYLKYPNQSYSSRGGNFVAITDKDGYYETIGIKDGKYEIGIGIGTPILFNKVYLDKSYRSLNVTKNMDFNFEFTTPMKIITPKSGELIKGNEFIVEWEKIQGAAYYTVYAVGFEEPENMRGSSITFALTDKNEKYKFKETKVVFNIESMKKTGLGSGFRTSDEIINPTSILGFFYNGIEMPILVSAYDEEGNKLNSSMPLVTYYDNTPSVKIQSGELTEGEKLILNKKYDKAIEHYENVLDEDETNTEALLYLARINMVDWNKDKKNISKAIGYGMRLYDITSDTDLIEKLLIEIGADEFRKYRDSIDEIFSRIPKEAMTSDLYWCKGDYYRYIGEFKKAREYLVLANLTHLNEDIFYIDIYFGENEKALERLRKEDTKFYYMSKEKLIEGIELLSKLDKNDKEYLAFREYLSRLLKGEVDYNQGREDFKKVYSSIKNLGIRIILNEIKIDNHWD